MMKKGSSLLLALLMLVAALTGCSAGGGQLSGIQNTLSGIL